MDEEEKAYKNNIQIHYSRKNKSNAIAKTN